MIDVFVGSHRSFEVHCRREHGMSGREATRLGKAVHFTRPADIASRTGEARLLLAFDGNPTVYDIAAREVHLMNLRSSA